MYAHEESNPESLDISQLQKTISPWALIVVIADHIYIVSQFVLFVKRFSKLFYDKMLFLCYCEAELLTPANTSWVALLHFCHSSHL
jgi:hypothetical protein